MSGIRAKPENDPVVRAQARKIEARAELLTNLKYLEEHVKNERINTKVAKDKLRKLRKIAIQQQEQVTMRERAKARAGKHDPVNPYHGRRRGEGIHTGKQAEVVVNFIEKVKFEVDPQFQRESSFTKEWSARDASSPITRGFKAPRAKTEITEVGVDAALSFQMGNRKSPLREHPAGLPWIASNGLNSKDYTNRER